MKKRILSLLLILCMTLTLLPTTAFAAEPTTGNEASIGTQEYATLAEAVNAAQDGQTVTLLKDVTVSSTIDIDKLITIDGDNKTITAGNNEAAGKAGFVLFKIGADNPSDTSESVTIRNCEFEIPGNDATNAWAAILVERGTLSGLTIQDNSFNIAKTSHVPDKGVFQCIGLAYMPKVRVTKDITITRNTVTANGTVDMDNLTASTVNFVVGGTNHPDHEDGYAIGDYSIQNLNVTGNKLNGPNLVGVDVSNVNGLTVTGNAFNCLAAFRLATDSNKKTDNGTKNQNTNITINGNTLGENFSNYYMLYLSGKLPMMPSENLPFPNVKYEQIQIDTDAAKTFVKVGFDAADGTFTFENTTGCEFAARVMARITNGTQINLPTPTKEGWNFDGWKAEVGAISTPLDKYATDYTVTDSVKFVAQWSQSIPEEKYTVTYTDGVDGEEIFKDQITTSLKSGNKTPAFNGTPTRDGYKFAGWEPKVAETVSGNATYTAQWEQLTPAETYTVTYKDGRGENFFKDEVHKDLKQGAKTPAYNNGTPPTHNDYIFKGWSPEVAETVTGNATYTAQWEAQSDRIVKELLGNIQVECVNTNSSHSVKDYDTSVGGYTAITQQSKDGKYTCTITVEANKYVGQYNTDMNVSHKLAAGEATTKTIVAEFDSYDATKENIKITSGALPIIFKVTCAQPQYIEVKIHTASAEKIYDGTALTAPTLVTPGVDAMLVYSDGSKAALKVALGADKDSTYYADLYLGDDDAAKDNHDSYAILTLNVTGSQTEVGESKNTYVVSKNSVLNFNNKLTGKGNGAEKSYIMYDDSALGTLRVTKKSSGGGSGGSSTTYYYFAIEKIDAQDSHTLNGAKFGLYLDGKQISTATSNRSGIALFRVSESDYRKINAKSSLYYQELIAPERYLVSSDKIDIEKSNLTTNQSTAEKKAETVRNYRSTTPDLLNDADHFAYVVGYQDGYVHPNALITRAETATIFFRLLKDEVRDGNLRTSSTFADVPDDYWANSAISTMTGLGIVQGRSTAKFDPHAPITRAEFAAICARFDTGKSNGSQTFTDIKGHWAEKYIERAAELGWIKGFEDGSFRPDTYITRAQAMTMINRVLNRIPEENSDLLSSMNVWPDCNPGDWFYLAVQEATNSHNFKHKAGNYETWTSMKQDPDWTRYEN